MSVFTTSSCDVGHNVDGNCKIASPVFYFLVDIQASGIVKTQMTRCSFYQ